MYGIITTVNKARLGAVRWQNRARRSRDAVKEELRMKKRNRLTICLVAGVLILAVSATAAFGSVNGYSKYKEAVKALALETDNFTANGTLKMICDGKEVVHVTEDYAMDGHNMSSHSISKDSMGSPLCCLLGLGCLPPWGCARRRVSERNRRRRLLARRLKGGPAGPDEGQSFRDCP